MDIDQLEVTAENFRLNVLGMSNGTSGEACGPLVYIDEPCNEVGDSCWRRLWYTGIVKVIKVGLIPKYCSEACNCIVCLSS